MQQTINRQTTINRPTMKQRHCPPPLQFGLSTLLWLMVAVGLIFGTLRWMQVPAATSLIVMAILAVSGLAVVLFSCRDIQGRRRRVGGFRRANKSD